LTANNALLHGGYLRVGVDIGMNIANLIYLRRHAHNLVTILKLKHLESVHPRNLCTIKEEAEGSMIDPLALVAWHTPQKPLTLPLTQMFPHWSGPS